MGGFASFMTGFSNTLAQSLTADTQARREGRLAEKTAALGHKYRTEEADLAHERSIELIALGHKNTRELELMKQENKTPEGFLPGLGMLPFNVRDSLQSKGSREYNQELLNNFNTAFTAFESKNPEAAKALAANKNFRNIVQPFFVNGLAPETIYTDDGVIQSKIEPTGQNLNPLFQEIIKKQNIAVAPREFMEFDPESGKLLVTLNAKTTDPNHKPELFKATAEEINKILGKGTYERWAKRWQLSGMTDQISFYIPGITQDQSDSDLTKSGPVYTRRLSKLPVSFQMKIKDEAQIGRFFKQGSLDSYLYEQYLNAVGDSSEQEKIAMRLFKLGRVKETGQEGEYLIDIPTSWYEDTIIGLAKAISYGTGMTDVTYDGNNRVTHYQGTEKIGDTEARDLQQALFADEEFFDSVDQLQDILLQMRGPNPSEQEIALGAPRKIASFLNSMLGTPLPEKGGERLKGWLEQIPQAIGILTEWGGDEGGEKEKLTKRATQAMKVIKKDFDEYETQILALEQAGTNTDQIKKIWENLGDKGRAAVNRFYIETKKVELTYKLASIWQGPSSRISDRDFNSTYKAIWNNASPSATLIQLSRIKANVLGGYLKNKVLLNASHNHMNARNVLQRMTPAIDSISKTADIGYRNAFSREVELINVKTVENRGAEASDNNNNNNITPSNGYESGELDLNKQKIIGN